MGPREFYEELPSTQDRANALARSGAEEGTRVVARRQTRGRGRLEHPWESPRGGLYLSIILRAPPERAGLLPLAIGASLAAAFDTEFGAPVGLKWPNDVLVRATEGRMRKLAGVLMDEVESPSLGRAAVAGIGVNVRLDHPVLTEGLRGSAAALDEFAPTSLQLDDVEQLVVTAVFDASHSLETPEGRVGSLRRCRQYLYGVGHRVSVDGRSAGILEGLGEDGELWLADGPDRRAIWAGDLWVEETP